MQFKTGHAITAAGALFGLGFFWLMDAIIYSNMQLNPPSSFPFEYYLPYISTLVAGFFMATADIDALGDMPMTSTPPKAVKIVVCISLLTFALGMFGAIFIQISHFTCHNGELIAKNPYQMVGVGIIASAFLNFLSGCFVAGARKMAGDSSTSMF